MSTKLQDTLRRTSEAAAEFNQHLQRHDGERVAGSLSATPEEAIKLYNQAEDILTRELPVLPLRYMPNTFGISTRVANVEVDPFRLVNWLKVTAAP